MHSKASALQILEFEFSKVVKEHNVLFEEVSAIEIIAITLSYAPDKSFEGFDKGLDLFRVRSSLKALSKLDSGDLILEEGNKIIADFKSKYRF